MPASLATLMLFSIYHWSRLFVQHEVLYTNSCYWVQHSVWCVDLLFVLEESILWWMVLIDFCSQNI